MHDVQIEMNDSYWETCQYRQKFDLIVIGAGIVGLSTALYFKEKNPKATVLVLERGALPNGASTKNAGFACFGSAGELIDDLKTMSTDAVLETVQMRYEGLQLLRKRIGDDNMDYQALGGFEVFTHQNDLEACLAHLPLINQLVAEVTKQACYGLDSKKGKSLGAHAGIICNQLEGQLDTGLMMKHLRQQAIQMGIEVIGGITIDELDSDTSNVYIKSTSGSFKAGYCVVATNGFANELLNLDDLKPGRAQVLITEPVQNLQVKGSFHLDKGYYYFRNIHNRILFGGGRNIDSVGETTTINGLTGPIQESLEHLLKSLILPQHSFKIAQRWSGIMGLGSEKKPIITTYKPNIVVAVRMGGMGVAIGSLVGKKAASLIT